MSLEIKVSETSEVFEVFFIAGPTGTLSWRIAYDCFL